VLGAIGLGWGASRGLAAPAAPSYVGIQRTVQTIRQEWTKPGAAAVPNMEQWNAQLDALMQNLQAYAKANQDSDRQTALNQVAQIAATLSAVPSGSAAHLQGQLQQWLQPRLRLAQARRWLTDIVRALPPSTDPQIVANRSRWVDFAENDLGQALRDYDGAESVSQRQAALRQIHELLDELNLRNQGQNWPPSLELSSAVQGVFLRPNLDVAADVATVQPVFDSNLVTTGPITRKGYTSMVTAGPKTGFGLLPSDDGIAFYNSQSMVSVTPIWDFQQQIAQDPQGRRAAKLYEFNATTYDWSDLTITAVLRPSGLSLFPSATHSINASVGSAPECGGEFGRAIAGLIGMNQQKITDKVYEGALPKFQQQIPVEAAEETQEKLAVQMAERNADLRSKYLPGNDTVAVRDILITNVAMRSRPEAVFVEGLFQYRGAPVHLGADTPQPPRLATTFDQGVTVDLHLGSLMTSAASGLWQKDQVQSVQNLMIVTKAVPPGTPPHDAVTVARNVDFRTYLKAVDEAKKAKDPRVSAMRVIRPSQPPAVSSDARGFLVVIVHDFQLEVPAPDEQAARNMLGVEAKVLRIKVPAAEVAISYQLDTSSPGAPTLHGKIEEFNTGTNHEVIAINNDENKGTPLTRFTSAVVLGAMVAKIRTQKIDVALEQLKMPGFAIQDVSPLDPSGWMRINLVRTGGTPMRESQPGQDVRPEPVKGAGATPTASIAPEGTSAPPVAAAGAVAPR
jgi:hypothetical protein